MPAAHTSLLTNVFGDHQSHGGIKSVPLVALPTDRPRPAIGYSQAVESLRLPHDLGLAIIEMGAHNSSQAAILLSAFAVLLSQYSGAERVLIGTLQTLSNANSLSGSQPIADVLACHIDLSDAPGFNRLCQRVQAQFCETAGRQTSAAATSFQFLFSNPATEQPLPDNHAAELCLQIVLHEPLLEFRLVFNAELFDALTIRQMLGNYEVLLQGIVEQPDQPVFALPLLTQAERQRLIQDWNQPQVDPAAAPEDYSFAAIAKQAGRTPTAIAVVFNDRQVTYRELDEQSNRCAHFLRRRQVGSGVMIAVCLPRSPELIFWILGILKTGGGYVALEPTYPAEQLRSQQEQTNSALLITTASLGLIAARHDGGVVFIEQVREELAAEPATPPNAPIDDQSCATVIFTSGSTGAAKAIPKFHGRFRVRAKETAGLGLNELDHHIFKTALDTTLHLREIFWPLITGAKVFIVPHEQTRDSAAIVKAMAQHQITFITLVPSLLRSLLEQREFAACMALRHISCFGEPLHPDLVQRMDHCHRAEISSYYGTTEAPSLCLWQRSADGIQPLGNLGHRLANWQLYVLDTRMQPVPIGVIGELFVGGPGLAPGYLNQWQLTEERFIPHPFSKNRNDRVYRTGDLVRRRLDGSLEFAGRTDFQVKIRGFRVEPGQVEAALLQNRDIAACAVVARPNRAGENQLVAFLVHRRSQLTVTDLRQHLSSRVPTHLIPTIFVSLEKLPQLPNGKLDRKALPNDFAGRLLPHTIESATLTDLEQRLVNIWREVLEVDRVGRQDNFFDLGGYSLAATRLVAAIENSLGYKLPVTALFHSPTIELLAERLTNDHRQPPWTSLVPLQPQGTKPPLFFVHGWGGAVFHYLELAKRLPPDQPSYGIQAVGLDGKVPRHITVEDMAAHYAEELMAFQPEGDFYLAGYSLGGLIATEVAQQLHRRNRRITFLGLLDSGPGRTMPWRFFVLHMASYLFFRCAYHFREWLRRPVREYFNYIRGRWRALVFLLGKNFSQKSIVSVPPPNSTEPPPVLGFKDYYLAVAMTYRLQPYAGAAHIFLIKRPGFWLRKYWSHIFRGGANFHQIQGKHEELLTSHEQLVGLAKSLSDLLNSDHSKP